MVDFNKLRAAATVKTATPVAPATTGGRKSRYAGVEPSRARPPMPEVGLYLLEVLTCSEGFNQGTGAESFKTSFEIVQIEEGGESHAVGDTVFVPFGISGKGAKAGLSRVVAMCMACLGFDDATEYHAFDPEGRAIDACTGEANEYSKSGNPIIGRRVICRVTRGKDDGKGSYYREYQWAAAQEPVTI